MSMPLRADAILSIGPLKRAGLAPTGGSPFKKRREKSWDGPLRASVQSVVRCAACGSAQGLGVALRGKVTLE